MTITCNPFLLVDEALLFHTGPRRMSPLVQEAVAHVLGDVTGCVTWRSRRTRRTSAAR